jgi:acyl-homoserine-lactone acylase
MRLIDLIKIKKHLSRSAYKTDFLIKCVFVYILRGKNISMTIKHIFSLFLIILSLQGNAQINATNISIARDIWGVPHIFAKTNAEVSYGLAWANAEDDFHTMQETLLAVKNMLGSVKGKEGAIMDMLAFILDIDRIVEYKYESSFTENYKNILKAYVQGVNDYARTFPEQVLAKKAFPITEKDIIKGAVMTNCLLDFVHMDIIRIFDKTIDKQYFESNFKNQFKHDYQRGSNGIAMNSSITKDGGTYITVNSHQPLEGPYAWYEAHLQSEEGMNIVGGTFAGGPHIFTGTTPNLSWAHTLPYSNLNDVYLLEMHSTESLTYRIDDKWLKLEERKNTTKVKLGFLKIPITKTFYRSIHGPVIESEGNYYALRFPATMKINALEQWYEMSLATNFTEFKTALNYNSLSGMNVIYADKEDNIYFLSAGMFPDRNKNYEWKHKLLPGNTSETLWDARFYPIDSMPQYFNPSSGFVFNMNSTPFNASGEKDNLNPNDFNHTMGYLKENTARSYRFSKLMKQYDKVSWDDFFDLKFDRAFSFPLYQYSMEDLELIRKLNPKKYPDLAEVIEIVKRWNGNTDVDNREASVLSVAVYYMIEKAFKQGNAEYVKALGEEEYVEALQKAKKHLLKYFGTLTPRLGDLQKHVRGEVELEVGGMPECIAALYSVPYKNGKMKSFVGDSYIQMVRFLDGKPEIWTINAFGACNLPDSPHYTDQMECYVNQQLKPMSLEKDLIMKEAKAIYTPADIMNKSKRWYKD